MQLVISFLLTTGIVITLIILWGLWQRPHRKLPQNILVVIFIFLFFVCFNSYGQLHGIKPIYALGLLFADPIGFFLGPLFYLYIQSLYHTRNRIALHARKHFLPFIFYFIIVTIPTTISFLTGKSFFIYQKWIEEYDFLLQLQAIYFAIYCVFCLYLLSNYKRSLKQHYSNLTAKDLSWVKHLLIGILCIMGIQLLTVLYEQMFEWQSFDLAYITTTMLVVMIIYLGYYGSTQSRILLPTLIIETEKMDNNQGKRKNIHHLSNASSEEVERLKTKLLTILEIEKPYLNADLTLGGLAALMNTTDKKLSTLLNFYLKTTFYDLINHYRVEAVKKKMLDNNYAHFSLLAVAMDCGFNSKSSFNRIFKKKTGFSPSAYKKAELSSKT